MSRNSSVEGDLSFATKSIESQHRNEVTQEAMRLDQMSNSNSTTLKLPVYSPLPKPKNTDYKNTYISVHDKTINGHESGSSAPYLNLPVHRRVDS